jgi:beta-barrel assembly-enhancing protease
MKRLHSATALTIAFAILLSVAVSAPAQAQIPGKIGELLKKVQQTTDQLRITDQQEQELGAAVSERIRQRYGVVQDANVHRYVALVGALLAQASSRPDLAWKFIVLDTDGVNAFAAPGGYIHVTRGALALVSSEAELAGVLAHEMIHVTEKHTIRAIQKGKLVQLGADQADLGRNTALFKQLVDKSTEIVMAGFGRSEELEADEKGVRLANRVGYSPVALRSFLVRLTDRNKAAAGKQGLFASHPEMRERLDALDAQIAREGLSSPATLEPRYRAHVSYKPTAQAAIAAIEDGAAGLTGGSGKSSGSGKDAPTTETDKPKKKGFGLSGLLAPAGNEKKSAEVTGSAAARGVDKERGAPGGSVKTIVAVTLTPAEIEAFRKEGNLK